MDTVREAVIRKDPLAFAVPPNLPAANGVRSHFSWEAMRRELDGLPGRPTADEMLVIADRWRPWRAVAARILWHHYLSVRATRNR